MKLKLLKKIRYGLEGLGIYLFIFIIRCLSISMAQRLSGALFKFIGPWTTSHKTALANLKNAFPQWSHTDYNCCMKKMWEGWGATTGLYPHINNYNMNRWTVEGLEHVTQPCLLCGGHFHGFPLVSLLLAKHNIPIAQMLRVANNPIAGRIMMDMQKKAGADLLIQKDKYSALHVSKALRQGYNVYMLIDQRLKGIHSLYMPFLHKNAWTAKGAVLLARRAQRPIVPVSIYQKTPQEGSITFHPPIFIKNSDEDEKILSHLQNYIAQDIIQAPHTWFWLHNRWKP